MPDELDLSLILQRFSSRVLWHFTGYNKSDDEAFAILNKILETNCLKVANQAETIRMANDLVRVGLPFSCMCDIPFRDLSIHTIRYGKFGIAFHKKAAIEDGKFNPVLYVHNNSPVFRYVSDLIPEIDKLSKKWGAEAEPLRRLLYALGSYTKPSDLTHPVVVNLEKDRSQGNNFYYEREWRSVFPWNFNEGAVAAIMVPWARFSDFRTRWQDRVFLCPLISTEMVLAL